MKWWANTFQTTLEKYIAYNVVIQDDQQLISDCIFRRNTGTGTDTGSICEKDFCITKVNETEPDKLWFMFRELLLWVSERTNRWVNERTGEWTNERTGEWTNKPVNERTGERTNEPT